MLLAIKDGIYDELMPLFKDYPCLSITKELYLEREETITDPVEYSPFLSIMVFWTSYRSTDLCARSIWGKWFHIYFRSTHLLAQFNSSSDRRNMRPLSGNGHDEKMFEYADPNMLNDLVDCINAWYMRVRRTSLRQALDL